MWVRVRPQLGDSVAGHAAVRQTVSARALFANDLSFLVSPPAKCLTQQFFEILKSLPQVIKTGNGSRNRGINTGHKAPRLKILGTKKAPLKSGANTVYRVFKGAWRF
jgi:hypothetical protein